MRRIDLPYTYTIPFLESPRRRAALLAVILSLYLGFALATARTSRPDGDEAGYANPSYNLAFHGFMGTTIYGEQGALRVGSMPRHTYWMPPLYFLANVPFFKLFGFGLAQVRSTAMLWGLTAMAAWYVLIRTGGNSPALAILAAGFIGLGYFFQLSAALGRMDMMCLALGTCGIAAYCLLRRVCLPGAVLAGNALVAASCLTHATGMMYFFGLGFLMLDCDWKRLRAPHVALAALPYLLGAAAWGAYIRADVAGFLEQTRGSLNQARGANGVPPGFSPVGSLRQEIIRRYVNSFGLGPGMPLANRSKSIVLLAYCAGLAGSLCIGRIRRDPLVRVLLILAAIDFAVLAFIAPSKNYYYLPHTTAVFSACLAITVLRAPKPGGWGQSLAVLALAALAGLQLAGLASRDHQRLLQKSYLPAIEAIRQYSKPGDLIFGPVALWLSLQPDRELLDDWKLGYASGRRGSVIVLDPMKREVMEDARLEKSPAYSWAKRLIEDSRKAYDDGYYAVYVPPPSR
ncbi:MAG TPA: hypothetical protein VIY49_34605 [Bryobacteraceae bacterium]